MLILLKRIPINSKTSKTYLLIFSRAVDVHNGV